MSQKPGKYCAAFPCPKLAVAGSAYCIEHRPAPAIKDTRPFYLSVRWRRFRDWYLINNPLCEICEREGRLIRADLVDHIIEIQDGGAMLDADNTQALCRKCHAIKTAAAKNHRKVTDSNRRGSRRQTF